jgi:hypothetical protein
MQIKKQVIKYLRQSGTNIQSRKQGVAESYWTKLQNERNTKINSLINELKESIK